MVAFVWRLESMKSLGSVSVAYDEAVIFSDGGGPAVHLGVRRLCLSFHAPELSNTTKC